MKLRPHAILYFGIDLPQGQDLEALIKLGLLQENEADPDDVYIDLADECLPQGLKLERHGSCEEPGFHISTAPYPFLNKTWLQYGSIFSAELGETTTLSAGGTLPTLDPELIKILSAYAETLGVEGPSWKMTVTYR